MIPIPSLPTETLYKFLALGGLIVAVVTALYSIGENKQIEIDNIKLDTKNKIYMNKTEQYLKEVKVANKEYEKSISTLDSTIRVLEQEHKKNPRDVYYFINKSYTFYELHDFLLKKEARISNSYDFNRRKRNASIINSDTEELAISEQEDIITVNEHYINQLNVLSLLVFCFGCVGSVYGFSKWHQTQIISDELSKIQLAKAKAELSKIEDKPKIIL
jgi:hypothetical protein